MSTELLTMVSILVLDWVVAQRAMAYTTQRVAVGSGPITYATIAKGPKFKPFYEKKALGTDAFHIVGWIRYPALAWFAWLGFGMDWWWYAATALVNALGWGCLKVAHGKADSWGLLPRWFKQLMGRS